MKHAVRTNKSGFVDIENYTRGKAIRIHCTECMGHEENPVNCTSKNCALYPYRKKTYMAYENKDKKDI